MRARLDPVEGSEQGGERPVIVVSPDFLNERSPVVLVAAITSRKVETAYRFEAVLDPPDGGLPVRSKVMAMHLRCLDQARLIGRYGSVSRETMKRVDEAIAIATGLVSLDRKPVAPSAEGTAQ